MHSPPTLSNIVFWRVSSSLSNGRRSRVASRAEFEMQLFEI